MTRSTSGILPEKVGKRPRGELRRFTEAARREQMRALLVEVTSLRARVADLQQQLAGSTLCESCRAIDREVTVRESMARPYVKAQVAHEHGVHIPATFYNKLARDAAAHAASVDEAGSSLDSLRAARRGPRSIRFCIWLQRSSFLLQQRYRQCHIA